MTQVTPPSWSRVKEILADALDREPAAREAFLDEACAGQPQLRSRVAALVRAYGKTTSLGDEDSPARAPYWQPDTGARVGRYRIVRLIGRGGMGSVYEAIDEQLGRPVAVKLLQPGLASRAMLRRFELEPRLLARLRHPGIAQIFEAGTIPGKTGDPAPFFAMELVADATPITAYAEAHRLPPEDRLRLFLKVCDAVTHGHQRSVIHRDLKPANILVDGSGQPKIIDFGVGRVTDPGATAATIAGELIGTLRYMSPEQFGADGAEHDDVDVRADVYALGVVLYELLTGRAPHPDPEGGVVASIRAAQHRTPVPLSRLTPTLSGDIETIALKAVEPDRALRYQSVADLAADLQRFLDRQPISARPHTAIYQLRMFARRHRALVAGIAAIFAALTLGIIGTSIGLFRAWSAERAATAQTRRAERISAFLKNTIRAADPHLLPPATVAALNVRVNPWESWLPPPAGWGSAGPAEVGVVGVLRHAAGHLETEFGDDPELLADLSILLGFTLSSLEDRTVSLRLLESAVAIQSRILPADDEALIRTRVMCAGLMVLDGRDREADGQLRAAYASAQRRFGPMEPRTLLIRDKMAETLAPIPGRFDEALAMARETIRDVGAALGPDSTEAMLRHQTLINLLSARSTPDDRRELVAECRATIEGLTRAAGPNISPISPLCWSLAGTLQSDPATLAEAEALQRQALDIDTAFAGSDSNTVYDGRSSLYAILLRQRKLAEAEVVSRQALDSALRMIGPRSPYTYKAQGRLARVLTWEEKGLDEAEHLAHLSAAGSDELFGPKEDFACYHNAIWAAAVRLLHQPKRAESMLRERIALRGQRSAQPGAAWVEAYQYLQLALCLADENRQEEAAAAIRTAHEWADQLGDRLHPLYLNIVDVQPRLDPGAPASAR